MTSETDLTVREAQPSDIPAIAAIYRHWVETSTASFELAAPDEAEMQRRFDAVRAGGYPYLVAEAGGTVAGYAYAGAYRPRPAYRFTAEDSIYLAPGFTGRGAGRQLLDVLLTELRRRGHRSVIAVISDPDANAASVGLHRAAWFVHFGTAVRIGFKFDRWLDVAYMQLEL